MMLQYEIVGVSSLGMQFKFQFYAINHEKAAQEGKRLWPLCWWQLFWNKDPSKDYARRIHIASYSELTSKMKWQGMYP